MSDETPLPLYVQTIVKGLGWRLPPEVFELLKAGKCRIDRQDIGETVRLAFWLTEDADVADELEKLEQIDAGFWRH